MIVRASAALGLTTAALIGTHLLGPPGARAAGEPEPRTAYDLAANRVHAVAHAGGRLQIAAGGLDFLKYIDGDWKTSWVLGQKVDGRAVALVSGLSSTFFAPVDHDGDGAGGTARAPTVLRVVMRGLAPGQRVTVFANEKSVGTVEVSEAFAPHDLAIPAEVLQRGENRFRLQFRSTATLLGGKRAAAVASISLGAAGPDPEAPPTLPLALTSVTVAGQARPALQLPGASRLSFYVQVPAGAKLAMGYAGRAPGASVLVRVTADGVAARPLFEGPAPERWSDAAWDLGAVADRAVRIDLVARGGAVAWASPRLMVSAPRPGPAPAVRPFDHVYIWMVDTLRADKLTCYNPKSPVATPNFDAFAADATRFAWAQVPGTWSLPSHASILTGVYPIVHKATAHEAKLSRDVPFLAESLKKAGYKTAIFSSNGYISAKWGFDRGWDESRNFIRENLPNGADYIWKIAKPWVVANATKSSFVYFATVEPHVIYNPKKEFLAKFWDKPYKGPIKPSMTGLQLGQIKQGKLKVDATDKAYLEALHNAEIAQADSVFAHFIADLKQAGLYDRSAIVVISDHGDEFWEHGDVGHAQSVFQELVHVPLIIRAPGALPKGHVVKADVEAMDVYPTLMALAGRPIEDVVQGDSLLPLAHDELARSPRASLTQNGPLNRGMKSGRYRVVIEGPGALQLYDEVRDPREQQDIAPTSPIALRQMRNTLGLLLGLEKRWNKRAWGTAAAVTEAIYGVTP